MLNRCLRSHLAFAAAFALCAASLFGQSSSATISGRVVDASGAAVAGAEVHVINQVDKNTRMFSTTTTGDFLFPNLEPGTYTITAKATGFKQYERKDLILSASDRLATGDLKLEVGAITETVEVVSQAAPVQTASAERSGLLDSKQVMELMARGRDVMALLQILPGAVDDNTGERTRSASTRRPTMSGHALVLQLAEHRRYFGQHGARPHGGIADQYGRDRRGEGADELLPGGVRDRRRAAWSIW